MYVFIIVSEIIINNMNTYMYNLFVYHINFMFVKNKNNVNN